MYLSMFEERPFLIKFQFQGEEGQSEEKKPRRPPPQGRPFLLRRGTAAAAPTGSFKRRSLKLRRSGKETKDLDCDCKYI